MELKHPKVLHGVRANYCPVWSAFVTSRQCKANRALVTPEEEEERGEIVRKFCLSCPGVVVLWQREQRSSGRRRRSFV
jgi:hypothetical protein